MRLKLHSTLERRVSLWQASFAPKLVWVTCLFLLLRAVAAAGVPNDQWPMFRGSPGLAGISGETLPAKLNLLWTFKTGGPVKSSPAISQARVFIGSGDGYV